MTGKEIFKELEKTYEEMSDIKHALSNIINSENSYSYKILERRMKELQDYELKLLRTNYKIID